MICQQYPVVERNGFAEPEASGRLVRRRRDILSRYSVEESRESLPEATTPTPVRPGMIDTLPLAGLALRPPPSPRALILSRNSALG
jgi:hypothetical protein